MFRFAGDIPSSVTQGECAKLVEFAAGKKVIELGSHFGRSTIALASVAEVVHAVDWHQGDGHIGKGDSAEKFLKNITKYRFRKNVVHHMGRFEDVLPLFKPGIFDLAFIDAYHTKEAVLADVQAVYPLVKAEGVIAFHDYGRKEFGVTEAVQEFAKSLGKSVEVTESLAVIKL